jgi:hypothetical protein
VPDQLPAFAEIGCVNAWRSVGALRMAPPHVALCSGFEPLWRQLTAHPVGQNTRHAKAIEFGYEQPLAHWFGLPVSTPGEPHAVSEALLRQALGTVAAS